MHNNTRMKYLQSILIALSLALSAALSARAQHKQEQPEINYTANAPKYKLGGIAIDGIKGYDDDLLINISGLTVGQVYEVPGASITQAVQNYWKQGLFSNVKIEADSIVGEKIYLHIKLSAQPRISSISFTGLKKSEREEIEQRIPLRAGNQITPNLVDRSKRRIQKYFEEKGYKNAAIDITQREDITADNKMLVDIKVNKNDKIKVRKIYITGVDEKMVKPLKNAMKKTNDRSTLKKWFSFSRKYLADKYEEDKGFLIDKLNEWGYRDALIVSDSVVQVDPKHVDVHLNIRPGQKYYLRNVSWVGNTIYPSEALSQTFQMQKGDLYNQALIQKRLQTDEDAIGKQYYNSGYVFSGIEPVEIKVEGDSVDLEMRVTEGKQATFNRIRIAGNDRVYDHVIRRELRTKPGDLFSMDALERSIRELASMNQFDPEILQSQIQQNIKPDPTTGTVDITYPLVTKGADQVEMSLGWGQTGVIGRLGFKFTNFSIQDLFGKSAYKRAGFIPQGNGQTLSISGQTNGQYYQSYSINFVDPWFGGKRPNQLSVSAFYSRQTDVSDRYYNSQNYYNQYLYGYNSYNSYGGYGNYSNYYDPDKYMQLFGLNIGFGKRLRWPDDYFNLMLSLGYTRYNLKNWQYFLFTNGSSNNINLSMTLARSSTDNGFFPRRGSEFVFNLSLTPPYSLINGKDYSHLALNPNSPSYSKELQEKYRWIEYHKWSFKLRTYTALSSGFKHTPVLMTRAEVGVLGAYNKHLKSPFETYYVGGDGMSGGGMYGSETIALRGYDNGSLAGNVGNRYGNYGYAYTRLSLELRFPLMLQTSTSIYALAFAEAGNAWQDVNKVNPFQLRKSAGVGVRLFLSFIGLMGIDWAYGFDKTGPLGGNIGGSHFHFILGQEF